MDGDGPRHRIDTSTVNYQLAADLATVSAAARAALECLNTHRTGEAHDILLAIPERAFRGRPRT